MNEILATIASEKLGIETLETQKSDRLDFHDLAVWSVRAALEAAFEAGQRSRETARPKLYRANLNGRAVRVTIPQN